MSNILAHRKLVTTLYQTEWPEFKTFFTLPKIFTFNDEHNKHG